jgi:hypothetical protein
MKLEAGDENDRRKREGRGGVNINIHIRLELILASQAISKPICNIPPAFIRICEGVFGNVIVLRYSTVLLYNSLGRVRGNSFVWVRRPSLREIVSVTMRTVRT